MSRHFPALLLCISLVQPLGVFAQPAAPIRSAQSGAWSADTTWVGGKVPATGDRVQVRAGHRVVYDLAASPRIRSVHVAGTLTFAADRDTCLDVGLIKVQPGDDASENGFDCDAHLSPGAVREPRAELLVGTPDRPIDARHTARIRLVYCDGMDKESCPAIVCCGGRMELHGAPLSRAWVKLGATADAGATEITLAEAVTGWRAGDRIIVTATARDRGLRHALRPNVATPPLTEPLTEERLIRGIAGTTLTLDRPLAHSHLGSGAYRGEVANLSRNVIVESLDPQGIRGHTMYHRGSAGSISYSEFRHLGKRGVLGRYALHYHLCGDTMRGSSVVGASVWDSANRWLTVHGTDYLVVRDCVGYRSVGHGFYLEDGTETCNVFDRNLAVGAVAARPLPNQALPFDGNDGAGFWWANCRNSFTRNVACDCDRYGFRFEASPVGGFDLRLPVRQADGSKRPVDVRTLPFICFDDNEAHGCAYGINLGEESRPGKIDRHSGVGPDERHPFVLRNTRVWNTRWAMRVESPSVMIDSLDIHASVYGFYRSNFNRHAYDRLSLSAVGVPEAFHDGEVPPGLKFPDSGNAGFARVGARFSDAERTRFVKLLDSAPLALAPADAERLVRGSYNTGGKVDNRPLPRIFEDPQLANGSGVSCGPLRSTAFPRPLDPVDDLPPATVITSVQTTAGRLLVRGTTCDNGRVTGVRVNGHAARPLADNYAQWEVTLAAPDAGPVQLSAAAEDSAGNHEKTPHRITFSKQ
jgi:hypothetical protein